MNSNLLNRIGRSALIALVGAFGLFSSELAGLIPELSGFDTLIISSLIGLVSLVVERLRDTYIEQYEQVVMSMSEVPLLNRILRGLAVALVGGLALLSSEVLALTPELSGLAQVAIIAAGGVLSLLVEYLRDYFDLEQPA